MLLSISSLLLKPRRIPLAFIFQITAASSWRSLLIADLFKVIVNLLYFKKTKKYPIAIVLLFISAASAGDLLITIS